MEGMETVTPEDLKTPEKKRYVSNVPRIAFPSVPSLTEKQAKYVELREKGLDKEHAKRGAGYSLKTATTDIEAAPNVRKNMALAIERAGITDDFLAKRLKHGVGAYFTELAQIKGRFTDSRKTPNFIARERYIRLIAELSGRIKNDSADSLNIGVVMLPTSDTGKWNEAATSEPKQVTIEAEAEPEAVDTESATDPETPDFNLT